MPVNRPVATLLATIALLLAIVAGFVVLGDQRGARGPPAAAPARPGGAARERAHARAEHRQREDAAPEVETVPPVEPPERLAVPEGSGFVVGTVTDQVGGDAVPGARVRLLHATGEEIAVAATDHAGHYQLDGVPETLPLVLELSHPGHLTGLCCDVRVRHAEILRKDVALIRSPRVALHLTDSEARRTAADVPVRVMDGLREVATGRSDADGDVELHVAEQGLFQLRVGGEAWAPRPAEELRLQPGLGDVERSLTVERGGGLEIRVRDAADQPVPGATVTVRGRGLEPVSGAADARGEVTLGPFATAEPLRVTALAADGTLRAARTARARPGYDEPVELTLRPSARVAGVVRDADGREVRGAVVEVVVPEDGALLGTVRTDETGRFSVSDLPAYDVDVVVRAPAQTESRTRTRASGEGSLAIRLDPAPSATLVGSVLGPGRAPVPGARVRVVPGDVEATSGADGTFELRGVPPGVQQRVIVEAEGLRVSERGRADRLLVTLDADERQRIEIQMEPGEAETDDGRAAETRIRTVRGRIVRSTGAPVAAAAVSWAGLVVATDGDGRFELARPPSDPRAARPRLLVTPPAGLLEPAVLPLPEPDENGAVDLADVGLRSRPTCRFELSGSPATRASSFSFVVLLDTDDHLLGRETEPFAARTCVTYDGSWLHVAAPEAWRSGGHRGAWVGFVTDTGPIGAPLGWPCAAGAGQVASPVWRDVAGKAEIEIPAPYRGGTLRLRLDRPPQGAPYERMGLPLEITRPADSARVRLRWLSAGIWTVDLTPAQPGSQPTLRTTISDGRTGTFRVAR